MAAAIDWIDVKSKYKLDPAMPEVKKLDDAYAKSLKALSTQSESIAAKAKTEKDPKKKKELEDSAIKTHQAGLIKLRKEIEAQLAKIIVRTDEPPRRIQVDHAQNDGTFAHVLDQYKLNAKDPKVVTAFTMYNKAVDALAAKGNADLLKAANEKDPKKRAALEQAVLQAHQKSLGTLRTETSTVLSKAAAAATAG